MEKHEINIEIAKKLGWTKIEFYEDNAGPSFWCGAPPLQIRLGKDGEWEVFREKQSKAIPNYCGDLNLIQAAFKTLNDEQKRTCVYECVDLLDKGLFLFDATASQWAEAFLIAVKNK